MQAGRRGGAEVEWSSLAAGSYVLVYYHNGALWHERLLLWHTRGSCWVVMTP